MKKIIVVADWCSDSLPCQEFRSAISGFSKQQNDIHVNFVESTPSTVHAAFLTAQIVETEERYGIPEETVIFTNVDPRLEKTGADLVVLKLASGIYVYGPNTEYCFSLVKSKINELFGYQVASISTQFRSRDMYARIGAHLADEMEDEMQMEELSAATIPALVGRYIGHIDNFGNIKTTIPLDELKGKHELKERIKIKINNVEKEALFVDGLFQGERGELVIYPGSSGPKDNPYLEISVWQNFQAGKKLAGVSAFNEPLPGMTIILQ